MDKKEYITIGIPTITKELFRNVLRPLDNMTFKPSGGLWASDYLPYSISPWFNYLRNNPDLLYYKDIYHASSFTLKDTANILLIDNNTTLQNTLQKYPSYHHLLNNNYVSDKSINYELLSNDYDGLYLDHNKLFVYSYTPIFRAWSVNTLLLFNLDVIDKYKSLTIDFYSPKNYDYPYIKEEQEKKVEKESIYHKELTTYIEILFNTLAKQNNHFVDYDNYFSFLIECTKTSIQEALKSKHDLAAEIKNYLSGQNIHTTEYIIIRNIATNILSNYLKNNSELEKKLPKTKIKKISEYPIEEN